MLVAGVDVGNSTTEVAFARVEPGRAPAFQLVLRGPTSGPKGSLACVDGVRELLDRGARRLGEPARRLLLAELHPVETALLELGRDEEHGLGRAAIARPASDTPSGLGVGAGTLRRLADLAADPPGTPVIAIRNRSSADVHNIAWHRSVVTPLRGALTLAHAGITPARCSAIGMFAPPPAPNSSAIVRTIRARWSSRSSPSRAGP